MRWPAGIAGRMVTSMTTCGHCGRRIDASELADELARAVTYRVTGALILPILRHLARIEHAIRTGDQAEMTALDDLRAADQALADTVTELTASVSALSDGVTQLDSAFDDLKQAVETGSDADIAAEVEKLQAVRDQLVAAKDQADASKAKIDEDFSAEPPAPGEPGGTGGPADTGEATPDPTNPASIV